MNEEEVKRQNRLLCLQHACEVFKAMAPTTETEGKVVKASELADAIVSIAVVLEGYIIREARLK